MRGDEEIGLDHFLGFCEEPSLAEVVQQFEAFVALQASDFLLRDGLLQMQWLLLQWLFRSFLLLLLFLLCGVEGVAHHFLFLPSLHPALVVLVDL